MEGVSATIATSTTVNNAGRPGTSMCVPGRVVSDGDDDSGDGSDDSDVTVSRAEVTL